MNKEADFSQTDAAAFLAALVDSSDDAIVGKSPEGIVRSWNPAAERLFGYTAQEMVGRSISVIIPHDRLSEESDILARLKRRERIEHFETTRRAKDGRMLTVSLTVSPVIDAEGRIIGASKIVRDLTERRNVERALRESESGFRTLADNIAQLAWMADETGSVFWYNERWLNYTGMSIEQMKGWGWRAVHHPDHVENVTRKFRAAIGTGTIWEDTFPLRGRDGQFRWFLSRALPIRDDRGRVLRWFGTNTDITERMAMEESLRKEDERKNRFLAVLAHELRNPLAPVRSGVALLQSGVTGAPAKRVLDTLDRQTAQLLRLVDDLLDVSRITQEKIFLQFQPVALSEIVCTAVETSQPGFDEAGLELRVDVAGDIILHADAVRLAQVFANLLNNAAKYTPVPGRVVLAAQKYADQVEVTISDTGVGIAPAMLERVFEMFQQGQKVGSTLGQGLGIGLTLVKTLVELHGGTVRAQSAGEGLGSQFVVRLPCVAASDEPCPTPRAGASTRHEPLKILVADDNADAADLLQMLLERQGHNVLAVYDGQSALAEARTFSPDVMLLDLGMPEPDGYEVARRVRSAPWGSGIVLVALTGWGQTDDRVRTQSAGFAHHLLKPAKFSELCALLDKVAMAGDARTRV